MSPKGLAFVGCRLLAIYVFLGVLQVQAHNLYFYLQSFRTSDYSIFSDDSGLDPYFLSALLNLGFCLVLWFRAGWIAERVAAGATEAFGEDSVAWSHQSAVSIVAIAAGLWILILSVPQLAYLLQSLIQRGHIDFSSIAYVALALCVGLVCVFSPSSIAGAIVRVRRW